jgi:hypothetical protein
MRLKVKINGRLKDEKSPGSRMPEIEVVDAETGERLRWVRRVSIECEAMDFPVLKIETYDFDAEIECEAVENAMAPLPDHRGLADVTPIDGPRRQWKVGSPAPDEAARAERARQILRDFKAMKAAEAEGRESSQP